MEAFFWGVRQLTLGRLLSIRLSAFIDLSDRAWELAATTQVAKLLNTIGVDIIDLSAGYYTVDRNLIYPANDSSTSTFSFSRSLCDELKCLVSFCGQASNLDYFQTIMSSNQLLALGRSFIADPEFARKYKTFRAAEINHCRSCRHCHYFSRGRSNLECGVNPNL